MKNQVILPILGLVFACFSLQAQVPEQLAEKADKLRKVGAQLQSLPQKLAAAERGGILRLDSMVTFVNFIAGDSLANNKTAFEYPDPNHEIATDYLKFDDWAKTERATKVLDDQGRLLEAYAETWNEDLQTWLPNSWLFAYPHGDSEVLNDSIILLVWDETLQDWLESLKLSTEYDAQDRPLVETTIFQFDLFGTVALRDEHVYDLNGNNTQSLNFIHDGDAWLPYGVEEAAFDGNQETERISYVYIDDVTLVPENRWTKSYNGAGNLISAETWTFDPEKNDWVIVDQTLYDYDAAQRLFSLEFHSYDESFPAHQLTRYGYINDTDLKYEIFYVLDEVFNEWSLQSKTYYYYNTTTSAPSIPVSAERIQAFPNPTSGTVSLNIGPDAVVSVLDARGVEVRADVQAATGVLNLGALPAGVYYIRVLEDRQYKLATVVRQ